MFKSIPVLFAVTLSVCFYVNFHEGQCRQFKSRIQKRIQELTVNVIHECPVISFTCVNNGLLYKEEQLELMNTELKELGCKL